MGERYGGIAKKAHKTTEFITRESDGVNDWPRVSLSKAKGLFPGKDLSFQLVMANGRPTRLISARPQSSIGLYHEGPSNGFTKK